MGELLNSFVSFTNNILWSYVLIILLISVGLYFTVYLKGPQFKFFGQTFKLLSSGKPKNGKGVSSFQAFCISVASHVVGPEMKEMIDAFVSNDTDKAREIHLRLLNIFKDLFIIANPIPVKAALNMTGVKVGGLRLPLTEAREKVLQVLEKDLLELGKI